MRASCDLLTKTIVEILGVYLAAKKSKLKVFHNYDFR